MVMENRENIFIPFFEGLLNYDCQKCKQSCCFNGMIVMNLKERKHLLKRWPSLRYFFAKETNKLSTLVKFPSCWFLDESGLCHIHEKYGYSYKPLICRLHPFYVFSCRGEYIVLPSGCNLYMDKHNDCRNISFKQILKDAQEAIDSSFVSGKIGWSKSRLNLERKIFKDSRAFLDSSNYLDFLVRQVSLTTENEDEKKIKSDLLEQLNLWNNFLDVGQLSIENKRLSYELTVLTSLLRVGNLYLNRLAEREVPLALLALYFYMLLFLKNRSANTYLTTYHQLLNDIPLGLIYLSKEDLKNKHKSLADKLNYLRLLRRLRLHKLSQKVLNERNLLQGFQF